MFNASGYSTGRHRLGFVNEGLERAWQRGWFSRPSLEPQALLAAARQTSGLHDFGQEDGWRDRLDRLSTALHDEAALTPLGTTIAYGQLVAALAGRLRAAALWQRRPEIAEVPLRAPIIVVGQMRSGSTRMQRLLACDRRFAYTRFFESWNPLPRWHWLPIDDRRLRGWLALRVAHWLNPKFGVIHPVRPHQADEEIGLHNVALYGAAFEAQWRIPSFARHAEALDSRPIYAEFRQHLQTIKWLRRDTQDRPWILKLPQFSQDLDAVLHTFPDARIVVLDRAPHEVVGSSASLVHNQMIVQSHQVDCHWIGREWLRKVALRAERTASAREHHGVPSVDVAFRDMHDDWRREMRRVYAMLQMPFTPEAERAMAKFMARRGHRKLQRHLYDIADYGLTKEQIAATLRPKASVLAAA
ncbi:hypothetical protein HNO88_002718 [Novosphingobium chloroacetimidivorans]|uniref:Sulfotransferase n=1 Tax=Novosphingobium chloroacetimidivorans TaxID=1428314 RepID=A0A7W7KBU1_9SPHN|nr:sulfotransferase [Novosphingobium chloroacetimidivorans]MBB4859389.1 hypothetical protein [Novosphingobium chloroacetimidivorans]